MIILVMFWIITIGLILFLIIGFAQRKQNNAPYELIDENEFKAYNNKKELIEELDKQITNDSKLLEERAKELGIRKDSDFSNKIKTSNEIIDNLSSVTLAEMFRSLQEKFILKDVKIQKIDDAYERLKECYKFDIQKLINLSVDYCDWYSNQKDYYDPMNFESWDDSSLDDMKNNLIKINEIEKRLLLKKRKNRK